MNKSKEELSSHFFENEIDMNGPSIYHLRPYEEINGVVKDISTENGMLLVTFYTEKTISISKEAGINEKIQRLKGEHIGILNMGDNYHIRTISGKKEADT